MGEVAPEEVCSRGLCFLRPGEGVESKSLRRALSALVSVALDKQKSVAYSQKLLDKCRLSGGAGKGTPPPLTKQTRDSPRFRTGNGNSRQTGGASSSAPPTPCPPDSTCPLGRSQCDHRCPPCSHLASPGPASALGFPKPRETCWSLQSTFRNTKGDLRGSENKEAQGAPEQLSLQSLWAHRAGPSSVRLPGCGPAGAGSMPFPAHHSALRWPPDPVTPSHPGRTPRSPAAP